MLKYRELPPSEWSRLPEESLGMQSPEGRAMRVAVAEDGDEIVGVWCCTVVVHAEPVWAAPTYRGHPTMLRRLASMVKAIGRSMGLDHLVGIIPDDNSDTQRLCKHLEGEELPGRIFMMET